MKTPILVLLLGLAYSPLFAQNPNEAPATPPASQERPKREWREFSTSEVRDIVFNVTTGFMLFTVNGITYRHEPRSNSATDSANVSAVAATLAELRQAKRFKVSVAPSNKEAKTLSVVDLVILYDTLK